MLVFFIGLGLADNPRQARVLSYLYLVGVVSGRNQCSNSVDGSGFALVYHMWWGESHLSVGSVTGLAYCGHCPVQALGLHFSSHW